MTTPTPRERRARLAAMEAELADVRVEVRGLEAAVPEDVVARRRAAMERERQLAAAQASLDRSAASFNEREGVDGSGAATEEEAHRRSKDTMRYGHPHADTTFRVIYFALNAFFIALTATTPYSDLHTQVSAAPHPHPRSSTPSPRRPRVKGSAGLRAPGCLASAVGRPVLRRAAPLHRPLSARLPRLPCRREPTHPPPAPA